MPLLLSLPPEMLDAIFMCFDDLAAVLATASSCRRLHGIYHPRRNFILPRVFRNALGGDGVIAASWRTLDVEAILPNHTFAVTNQVLADVQALKENKTDVPSTLEDCKVLFDRARVVQQLEVLYSRSQKDRRTRTTSRLTPGESDKFRQAVHRLWLLGLYTRTTGIVQDLCTNAATRVPLFYSEYSAQDVYDIHNILDWLDEQVDESLAPQETRRFLGARRFRSLFAGPGNILKAYIEPERAEHHLRCDGPSRLSRDAWKDDVRLVFIRLQLLDETAAKLTIPDGIQPIIVLPEEAGIACSRCGARPGLRLWNGANWDYPPCRLRPEMVLELLPGNLKNNCYERTLLAHYLGITDSLGATFFWDTPRWKQTDTMAKNLLTTAAPPMTAAQILQALCDLPSLLDAEHRSYIQNCAFSGVTNADLLCGGCLIELVKARLWVFWVDVKLRATPKEDGKKPNCPHGYNCASQALKMEHAYDLNHACPDDINTWQEMRAADALVDAKCRNSRSSRKRRAR
ncbi:hypothetical protein EXIGLDRAFT_55918 [Exidia glandulosa HHB12029]|uniref:F-box domain-containing protein n=1 Tax=Exidia glandulosa HHB12029 TaxID=1314781 RepID=A0A165I9A2_EXIGL|nr:hypothetical protein EXIGLDRAFT_55918 [Exidia glandulosa HHB12029]